MGIDHPCYPQGKEVPTGASLYNSRRVDYLGSLITNLPIGEKVNQSQMMKKPQSTILWYIVQMFQICLGIQMGTTHPK